VVGFLSIKDVSESEHIGAGGHFLKPLDFAYRHQPMQSLLTKKAGA
jgi:hypothetical protein